MTEPTPAKNHARELPNTLRKTQSAVHRAVNATSLTTALTSRPRHQEHSCQLSKEAQVQVFQVYTPSFYTHGLA